MPCNIIKYKKTCLEVCQAHATFIKYVISIRNENSRKLRRNCLHSTVEYVIQKVEMNRVWQNLKWRDFCKANSIIVTAYSPLGARGNPWGSNALYEERILHEIAEAKGKTHAQVLNYWILLNVSSP
ncbi:deoxymugineic acid synthase 1-like [Papaver somniferum]|uniref:deoxymugineic acid synthase 1-like n=1 Tax=Papaver somniferum TaxID=3469 RepID=UPI000E6FFCAF|nr:deoxymugineic acid synthase 1-like [Papaver somniferum]